MRENRTSGSEGRERGSTPLPYPYYKQRLPRRVKPEEESSLSTVVIPCRNSLSYNESADFEFFLFLIF